MTSSDPNPYEPMPSAPPVQPVQPGPARPRNVTISFGLWMAVAALSLLNLIGAFFLDQTRLADELRRADPNLTDAQIDQAVSLAGVVAVAVPAVFLVVTLIGAFQMMRGRNWARIMLTVFGALLILLTLIGTAAVSPIIGFAIVLVMVGAIVLMFVGESPAYFSSRKASY